MTRIPGGIGPLALACLLATGVLHWLDLLSGKLFGTVFVLSLAISLLGSLPRFEVPVRFAASAALLFAIAGIITVLYLPGIAIVPYLAIALAYAQLTFVFAHGLMPGRQPILEQLIRMMAITAGGEEIFWRFVRRQCQLWTALGAAMTTGAIIAMTMPDARHGAGYAMTALVGVQLAVFVLSHLYARRRYNRDETWQGTLRAMCQPAIWSKLQL